jgi:hypothetical protein
MTGIPVFAVNQCLSKNTKQTLTQHGSVIDHLEMQQTYISSSSAFMAKQHQKSA